MSKDEVLGHRWIGTALARTHTKNPNDPLTQFRDAIGYPLHEPDGLLSFPWRSSVTQTYNFRARACQELPEIFNKLGVTIPHDWQQKTQAAIDADIAHDVKMAGNEEVIHGMVFNTALALTGMFKDALAAKAGKQPAEVRAMPVQPAPAPIPAWALTRTG